MRRAIPVVMVIAVVALLPVLEAAKKKVDAGRWAASTIGRAGRPWR